MRGATTRPESTGHLLALLNLAKNRFTPADCATKVASLRTLKDREILQAPSLFQLHETLCFLRAYPESPELLRLVDKALQNFAARVDRIHTTGSSADVKHLRDTGIAHTTSYYPFSHPMAQWLAARFPTDVEIDWEDTEGLDKIRGILPLIAVYAENDALDDERISLRDWVRAAKGTQGVSDLRWLLKTLERSPLSPATVQHLYDSAELLLGWTLREATASRTLATFPTGRTYYHRGPLKRGAIDLRREIRKPLSALTSTSTQTGKALIHLYRSALSVRHREFHPLTHATPSDVLLADMGRGLRVALVGVAPECRLPLEGYYSFLVLKNGVPVSYGGGGALLDRLEIAANIFETFRQGESAYIYSQICRAFHHLCGSQYFLVKRYQIGYENPEAIQSGAFWFYYKLGFRPLHPSARALAEAERQRIAAAPGYRSPRKTLATLAESDMCLGLTAGDQGGFRDLEQGRIGLLVTQHIARRYGGNRAAAVRGTTRGVARTLGIHRWQDWSASERMALERFAPILALIPDLPRWNPGEKRALAGIIRAKGGRSEAQYIRRHRDHTRFARALHDLADLGTPLLSTDHAR